MINEPIYRVPEAAALPWLRLSEWTIWDYLKTGRLKRTKVGGHTYVRLSELQKLVVETTNEPKLNIKPKQRARPARKQA